MRLRPFLAACALMGLFAAAHADAQGLLWSLPPDGTWVRYEGTYSQLVRRPDSTAGDLQLEWTRHLTIKSVGTSEESYRGQVQPCRWIEIKVVTGQVKEGPDRRRSGGHADLQVAGSRSGDHRTNSGRGRHPQRLRPRRSRLSQDRRRRPAPNRIRRFRRVSARLAAPALPQPVRRIDRRRHRCRFRPATSRPRCGKGSLTMEGRSNRSTNEAQIWRSDDDSVRRRQVDRPRRSRREASDTVPRSVPRDDGSDDRNGRPRSRQGAETELVID